MPDSIARASLWANTRYPQSGTGLNLAIGHAAYDAILHDDLTWEELSRSELTPSQLDGLVARAGNMHNTYDIACKLRSPEEVATTHSFTASRVAAITQSSVASLRATTANYAQAMLPNIPRLPRFVDGEVRKRAEDTAIYTLFERPGGQQAFRPEAVALGGVWQTAAQSLSSSPAMAASVTCRNSLRSLSSPKLGLAERQRIADELSKTGHTMRAIVRDAIMQHLPTIAEYTGVQIEEPVIYSFLGTTVTGVRPPSVVLDLL